MREGSEIKFLNIWKKKWARTSDSSRENLKWSNARCHACCIVILHMPSFIHFLDFWFKTFLQLLGQWHILQMEVIYGSQGFTQIHSLTVLLYILQANIDFSLNNFYNLGYLRILQGQANIYFHHFLWIFLQPRLQHMVIYLNVFVLYEFWLPFVICCCQIVVFNPIQPSTFSTF